MSGSGEFPSLMDEPDFLKELDNVESRETPASADRAIHVVRTMDRWTLHAKPATTTRPAAPVDPPPVGQIRAAVPLFLMMLIGVCVGAASSALILHDRVARLIALWSH